MSHRLSKPNPEAVEISALLDRVQMPDYERLRARAHLERAEAIADLIARGWAAIRSLANTRVLRPLHRAIARMA